LLGEAGVIDDHRAAGAHGRQHRARQAVADGPVIPWALVEELLQRLLVIAGTAVGGLEALGHRLDAIAAAIEQQAAEIDLGPAATGSVAEAIGHQLVEEGGEVGAEACQLFGVNGPDSFRVRHLLARET
jgi:hypothetical protein